jgi:hypothetical protein
MFRVQKFFADKMERWCCTNKKCKCNESPEIFGGWGAEYDAGSKACLNRQILNNSIKRKAMADKDRANRYTKNYEASTWILSLIKTQRTLAGTCMKHAPPNCFLSQQILKKLVKH